MNQQKNEENFNCKKMKLKKVIIFVFLLSMPKSFMFHCISSEIYFRKKERKVSYIFIPSIGLSDVRKKLFKHFPL